MAEDAKTILSVTWVLGSIATISFGTRMYTRFMFQKQYGWDDYFIILSWVRYHSFFSRRAIQAL